MPGTSGETLIHAKPGLNATDFRPEDEPHHVHLGEANDGPRVGTENFEPLDDKDARRMTTEQEE